MRLNILSQIINHYHDFLVNDSSNPRNDFPAHEFSENEDPLGGEEGITPYDRHNTDESFRTAEIGE